MLSKNMFDLFLKEVVVTELLLCEIDSLFLIEYWCLKYCLVDFCARKSRLYFELHVFCHFSCHGMECLALCMYDKEVFFSRMKILFTK